MEVDNLGYRVRLRSFEGDDSTFAFEFYTDYSNSITDDVSSWSVAVSAVSADGAVTESATVDMTDAATGVILATWSSAQLALFDLSINHTWSFRITNQNKTLYYGAFVVNPKAGA